MSTPEGSPEPGAAVRLIFAFDGDDVSLVSRQPVEMTVPQQHPVEESAGGHAFVAELRSAEDDVLHQTPLPDLLAPHREVFSEDPEENVQRVPVDRPSGAFTVVVPDHAEAEYVALVAGPSAVAAGIERFGLEAPRELGRFALREAGLGGTAS